MISRFVESQRNNNKKKAAAAVSSSCSPLRLADRYVCPYLRTNTNARKWLGLMSDMTVEEYTIECYHFKRTNSDQDIYLEENLNDNDFCIVYDYFFVV